MDSTVIVPANARAASENRLGLPSFKILGAAWAVCRELAERWDLGPAAELSFDDLLIAARVGADLIDGAARRHLHVDIDGISHSYGLESGL